MRNQYISDFGEELGELLNAAYQDWIEATYTWQEFSELVKTEGRVNLLLEVSPNAFETITKCMLDSVVLAICRLTDPAETLGETNISLLNLNSESKLYSNLDENTKAKLVGLDLEVTAAVKKAKPLRTLRNKFIAHSDAVKQRKLRTGQIENVSTDQIKIALDGIHSVFALLSLCMHQPTLGNEVRSEIGGISTLLYYLAKGQVMQERMFTPGFTFNQEIEDEIQSLLS